VATLGRSPRQAVDQSGLKSGFFTDDELKGHLRVRPEIVVDDPTAAEANSPAVINEVSVMTAHMIVFKESIVQDQSISREDSSLPSCETD
jgi:hypothetical protein